MKIYSVVLPDVVPLSMVTGSSKYGIGFLTGLVSWFCDLIGVPCNMYSDKIKMAQDRARDEMVWLAERMGADGIMDVHCQVDRLSYLMYGTAYKLSEEEQERRAAEERAKREEREKRRAEESARREEQERRRAEASARREEQAKDAKAKMSQIVYKNPDAPYWCGSCGKDGPYVGACPECGATMKKFNMNK